MAALAGAGHCRGVHAKCNFPLPEEEAFQAQLLAAAQQESWQGGQASPTAAPSQGGSSHAAFSEAVCIPCGEPHTSQPRSAVQASVGLLCHAARALPAPAA